MTDPRVTADRKLRILHVLRAPLGGLFRHVLDLTQEQVARGHAVGLVVDSSSCGERSAEILAALEPKLELGIKWLVMPRQPHLSDAANIAKVYAHARHVAADVLHGHGSKGGLYARAPGLLPRRGGPLLCYTPHGGSFNHVAPPLIQATYMGVERLLAAVSDVLLFESIYISNCFHQRIGDTRALVRIVQNGISELEFEPVAPDPDASDLLYIGELRAAKGIDTLLDATALLSQRLARPFRLTLVGSGPDRDSLESYARARGLADQVSFAGAMPARQAFRRGRMLVVPSRAESLPYIVLEAAGAQIPMVATNVGGIGEIFGPYRDRLIHPNDRTVLAAAIQQVIEAKPDIIRQQAQDLAAFVATRFSISMMVEAVIAGYRDGFARRDARANRNKKFSNAHAVSSR